VQEKKELLTEIPKVVVIAHMRGFLFSHVMPEKFVGDIIIIRTTEHRPIPLRGYTEFVPVFTRGAIAPATAIGQSDFLNIYFPDGFEVEVVSPR
jgi:hypothetical protein